MFYLGLSFDWRANRPISARVTCACRATGSVRAGAARIELKPPLPTVVAGYPPPRSTATSAEPLFARALVLQVGDQAVALASAEVLEIPPSVLRRVRERARAAGLTEVIAAATHAHTSFGGYDDSLIVQVAATGRFDADQERRLVEGLSQAVEQAYAARRPATLKVAQRALAGASRNRDDPQAPPDQELTALFADGSDGAPIAALFSFGCHPTLAARHGARLDGDWPSRAAQRLEAAGRVALFVQGALGDATAAPPAGEGSGLERMGAKVAEAVAQSASAAEPVEAELALATVELGLPPAQADAAVPRYLRRPAANFLSLLAPSRAEVTVLALGRTYFVFTPAEPTAAAGQALRERVRGALAPGARIALVSVAQGYVGYLETPEAMAQGKGEARRTLFGPGLQERLGQGIDAALEAMRSGP